jgi:hypothetical protein
MEIFTNEGFERESYRSIKRANDPRTFAEKVVGRLKNSIKKHL